jgi:HKD family nuclease
VNKEALTHWGLLRQKEKKVTVIVGSKNISKSVPSSLLLF